MELADGDALKAQKMERELSGLWYWRGRAFLHNKSKFEKREADKLKPKK